MSSHSVVLLDLEGSPLNPSNKGMVKGYPKDQDIRVIKAVEITSFCRVDKRHQVILKYARIDRGELVQINHTDKDNIWPSTDQLFYYQKMGEVGLAADQLFCKWPQRLGIYSRDLARLIFQNAPAS